MQGRGAPLRRHLPGHQRASAPPRVLVGDLERAQPARLAHPPGREEARGRHGRGGTSPLSDPARPGRQGSSSDWARERALADRRARADREREEAEGRDPISPARAVPARDVLPEQPLPPLQGAGGQGAQLWQRRQPPRPQALPEARFQPPPLHAQAIPPQARAEEGHDQHRKRRRAPEGARQDRAADAADPARPARLLHGVRVPDASARSLPRRFARRPGRVHQRRRVHRLAPPAGLLDRPVPALRRAAAHGVPAGHRALLGDLPVRALHGAARGRGEARGERLQVPARGQAPRRQSADLGPGQVRGERFDLPRHRAAARAGLVRRGSRWAPRSRSRTARVTSGHGARISAARLGAPSGPRRTSRRSRSRARPSRGSAYEGATAITPA